ncbi:MAG: hypothetical protein ACRDBG_03670 [Waterburya sp.]
MNLENLMKTTPEILAQQQYTALKEHVLDILDLVRRKIQNDVLELDDILFHSHSGDARGSDNNCINFGYEEKTEGKGLVELDIDQILEKMRNLRLKSKG